MEQMIRRLEKPKSPDIIFIDSVQFLEMRFSQYKELKERFFEKTVYLCKSRGRKKA